MNQLNPIEFLKNVMDKDEAGHSNATIVLQNETLTADIDGNYEPFVHDQATTMDGVLSVGISNGMMVLGIEFEDFDDYEYIRFKSVCEQFEKDSRASEEGNPHYLVVTVSESGVFDEFMTCFVMNFMFEGTKPMVKLLTNVDDALMYRLDEETRNKLGVEDDSVDEALERGEGIEFE